MTYYGHYQSDSDSSLEKDFIGISVEK